MKQLDEIAQRLEEKHIIGSAKGIIESQEILAICKYYRIQVI